MTDSKLILQELDEIISELLFLARRLHEVAAKIDDADNAPENKKKPRRNSPPM